MVANLSFYSILLWTVVLKSKTINLIKSIPSLWTVVNLTGQKISAHLLSTTVQKQPASALFFQHIREFSPLVGGASLIVIQNCSKLLANLSM